MTHTEVQIEPFLVWLLSIEAPGTTVKDLKDGTYVMAKPLMFHWTLIRGYMGDQTGYFDRWCYANETLAKDALGEFPVNPPSGYEPAGWHRHPNTGRRRTGGDPATEYVEW